MMIDLKQIISYKIKTIEGYKIADVLIGAAHWMGLCFFIQIVESKSIQSCVRNLFTYI